MNSYTSSKFRIFQIVSHIQLSFVPLLQIQSLDTTSALSNCNFVRIILVLNYAFPPFTSQTAFRGNCSAKYLNVFAFGQGGSLIGRLVLKAENRLPGTGDVILQVSDFASKFSSQQ
jgi:hypothetical protein